MDDENVKKESAQSTVRAVGSRALAVALITGFGQCEEENVPLSETQKVHVATMAIMAYDEILQGAELLAVDAELARILIRTAENDRPT